MAPLLWHFTNSNSANCHDNDSSECHTKNCIHMFQVRGYLAVAGGLDVPLYLGSRSTFPNGEFGGYQGRYLRPGDSLPIGQPAEGVKATALPAGWKVKYAGEERMFWVELALMFVDTD